MNTKKSAFISVIVIVAVAVLLWFVYSAMSGRSSDSDNSYSGNVISDESYTDFGSVTETNQEGIKVDEEGFIPVANDGGPIERMMPDDDASAREVEEAVCDSVDDLVNHRSRENRSYAFKNIKSVVDRIEYEPLKNAAEQFTGYDFNNPTINPLLAACND